MRYLKRLAVRFLRKLVPGFESQGLAPVVVDLDRMITEPVGILFQSDTFYIKPMTQQVFLLTVNEIAKLDMMRTRKDITRDEIVDAYAKLFSRCSDFTRKEINAMTDAQIGAVLQQIIDCVTGRAHILNDEKKKLQNSIPQPA